MTNYSEITDLQEIPNILKDGHSIMIVSPNGELETDSLDVIKDFIFIKDSKFYQVIDYSYINVTSDDNKKDKEILRHISTIMNSFYMGVLIKRYNNNESEIFDKFTKPIPCWDFVNYKYELAN